MAENSPLNPPSNTSTLSHNLTIPTTHSIQTPEKIPTSEVDLILDKPPQTLLSSEQSLKNSNFNGYRSILSVDTINEVSGIVNEQSPKYPSILGCPLDDSDISLDVLKGKLIDGNNVSEVQSNETLHLGCEVSGIFNGVSDDSNINEVSGVQLEQNNEKFEGLSDEDGLDFSVEHKMLNFDGNNNEVSGDDDKVSGIQLEENHEKSESFDGNGETSVLQLNRDVVDFDNEDEIDEFLELKDEVSAFKRNNSSEIVKFGSSESQTNDTLNEITSLKSKILDENSKNDDHVPCSMTMELIDETVVVVISDNVGKKRGRRGKKGNSNASGTRRKLKYSRKELQKLKFVNVKSQKKFWQEVYYGFDDNVRKEYDELGSVRQNNYNHKAAGKGNYCYQGSMGDLSSEIRNSIDATRGGKDSGTYGEDLVEWNEDDESDDEYHSIQRPAFMVEGEPDFESGSPEDGFEYLRRVRWEAAHIPKVKVVKPDNSKLTEQSVYMPKIPDIEKCPPHLVPLKHWEDEFIAEFSELRLVLSKLGDTVDATPADSDSVIFSRPECTKRTSKNQMPLELPAGGPTVSTLLAMDPVTRVGLLNKRISLCESASNLSKDDCAWLFALCAVVETPLDANTCASLRCLLRRCAKLRSRKDEFDDEVVMLNILFTIAGKIFGQSEK